MSGGKGAFYRRLTSQLIARGVSIVHDPYYYSKYDLLIIASNFSVLRSIPKNKKVILRLDGLAFDKNDKYISVFKKRVNGIIYQAHFCKYLFDRFIFKCHKNHRIIYNGADASIYAKIKPVSTDYQYNFISFANWKKSHRLLDIVESFLMTESDLSKLWIAGSLLDAKVPENKMRKYRRNKRLKFLGSIPYRKIIKYLKMVNGSIHIRWCDSCPNSVVETICAGVPVITNNMSGTSEIVAVSGGIVLSLDGSLKCFPGKKMRPPPIDRVKLAQSIDRMTNESFNVVYKHVDINYVAKKYLSFSKKILHSK